MANFQQLVFGGGGTRCFWHGGFLSAAREPLELEPQRIAAVSGGALSAACFVARRGHRLLEVTLETFSQIDENLDRHQETAGEGFTPHQKAYRDIVKTVIDEDAEQRIAQGPGFQVLVGHPPSRRALRSRTALAMVLYEVDLLLRSKPDIVLPKLAGVTGELIDARAAARSGKLVDLICAAATIPPVFDVKERDGEEVIDGGLTSKAPMPEPDEGRTLVLLTRSFRNLPDDPRLVYVQVSGETPADKLDFSDAEKIQKTWQQGEADAERFLRERRGD
jgi:predicted acylesterase/phospholipase RssA